jgi:hypothetical protein
MATLTVTFGLVIVFAMAHPVLDPDMWWHLAVGDAILQHRSVHFVDLSARGNLGLRGFGAAPESCCLPFGLQSHERPAADESLGHSSLRFRGIAGDGWGAPSIAQFPFSGLVDLDNSSNFAPHFAPCTLLTAPFAFRFSFALRSLVKHSLVLPNRFRPDSARHHRRLLE